MGHREALLRGAKQCLAEKGYARTTARDIVAASGTNLASIGYHYGSKEALLNEALIEANAEWGAALSAALARDERAAQPPGSGPDGLGARVDALWSTVTELFGRHRGLWAANFEAITQAGHSPDVRAALAKGLTEAQAGLGAFLPEPAVQERDERAVRAVGAFHQALITGVMAQWLIAPDSAPTGRDLSLALRVLAGAAGDGPPAAGETRERPPVAGETRDRPPPEPATSADTDTATSVDTDPAPSVDTDPAPSADVNPDQAAEDGTGDAGPTARGTAPQRPAEQRPPRSPASGTRRDPYRAA